MVFVCLFFAWPSKVFAQGTSPKIKRIPIQFVNCGNKKVDKYEQCDDGNRRAGDGCSSVCATEVCGNGAIDTPEECDDGNLTAGDGCDASCVIEGCHATCTDTDTAKANDTAVMTSVEGTDDYGVAFTQDDSCTMDNSGVYETSCTNDDGSYTEASWDSATWYVKKVSCPEGYVCADGVCASCGCE